MLDANKILSSLSNQSFVSPSYYDLSYAGISGLINFDILSETFFSTQNHDGSWGSPFFFREERLVNTLAVLKYFKHLQLESPEVERARFFCKKEVVKYADSVRRPVAFELIFPHLWFQVFSENHLPPALNHLLENSQRKLKKIPLEVVFSKPTTLLHTLEVFENHDLDWSMISNLRASNGNVGNSPSSTIIYHDKTGDSISRLFLHKLLSDLDASVPVNYPIDIFERNWILYFIEKYSLPVDKQIKETVVSYLLNNWTNNGIAWSKDFSIPDLDDTAVSWILLHLHNHSPSSDVFSYFENNGEMTCFPGEIQSSTTHLAHFIEAARISKTWREHINNALLAIRSFQNKEGFWLDKWHVSPYYATSQVILSCADLLKKEVEKATHWILKSQNTDGGWGSQFSTMEETAYAILSLDYISKSSTVPEITEAIKKSTNFFMKDEKISYIPLWIDKNLYCPYHIVDVVVLTAKKVITNQYE